MSQNGSKLSNRTWKSGSTEETLAIGSFISSRLKANDVVCLFGELGAGKTTLIKGLIQGRTGISLFEVTSPTFVYMTPYRGNSDCTIYHFDLYRLKCQEEFSLLGFEEFLSAGGICCIEWSERIPSLLPKKRHEITVSHLDEGQRKICYEEFSI